MNNNNYLFYRKYFDFEKNNLSRENCINEILEFNSDLNNNDLVGLRNDLNRINDNAKLNIRRNIENLKFINKSILNCELVNIDISDCGNTSICLNTTYPGLLLGTGYSHDYKAGTEEVTEEGFKIGFYFDYTTGMPVIPGTSVKGMLRSGFPQKVVASKNGRNKKPKYIQEKTKFVTEELKALGVTEEIEIDILEREIFDGLRPQKNEKGEIIKDDAGEIKFKPFSVYKRDTFFEAIPVDIHNTNNVLFEDDALAVHKVNLLKNPTPIKFLKVAPNVEYQFHLKLFPSEIYPCITAEIKRSLFEVIILTFGIGAKTNVGYGQFTNSNSQEAQNHENGEQQITHQPFSNSFPKAAIPFLKKDKQFEGEVFEQVNEHFGVKFTVNNKECVVYKKQGDKLTLEVGMKVLVKCANDFTQNNHNISVRNIK